MKFEVFKSGETAMKTVILFTLCSLLTTGKSLAQEHSVHKVTKGETVSSILFDLGVRPLYGEGGWSQKILDLNRVTLHKSRTLIPGDLIIIPGTESKVKLDDTISLKSSALFKNTGVLRRSSAKNFQFLFYTDLGRRGYNLGSSEVADGFNYGVGVEAIRESKKTLFGMRNALTFGGYINTQRSLDLGGTSSSYAQFSPNYKLYVKSSFHLKSFSLGPALSIEEESNLLNEKTSFLITRDRFVNAGINLTYSKIKNLDLSLGSYYSVYSKNLDSHEKANVLSYKASADLNLINNFRIGVYANTVTLERESFDYGLRISKLFK